MSRIRNTAVALAGAACVGLTGAAASVVMSNLDVDIPSAGFLDLAMPPPSAVRIPRVIAATAQPALSHSAMVALISESESASRNAVPDITSTTNAADEPTASDPTGVPKGFSGGIQIDDYYLGAAVMSVRASVLGLNINTNLLHALPEILLFKTDVPAENGNTAIRSEVDARHGDISTVIDDPELERSVDMSRKPAM